MKQLGDKKKLKIEENNERESLTKIHTKDMLSSKDLSCATHLTLIGVPNEHHQKQIHKVHPKVLNQQAFFSLVPT